MQAGQLINEVKVTRVKNAVTAGTTDVTCTTLDMAGWDGVLFLALLGDVTATSVLQFKIYTGSDSGGSGAALPTGGTATTAFTAGASDADNLILLGDAFRPQARYVTGVLLRGTANAVVDGIVAIQYRGRTEVVTQSSSVLAQALSCGK